MDKKLKLKTELVKKLKKETSVTGTGASVTPGTGEGVATKYAFGKRDNKGTPSDWKPAPSVPNRSSKVMDYKELWEAGEYDSLVGILKQLGAEEDSIKVLIKAVEMGALKPTDAIRIVKKALGTKGGLNENYNRFRNETKTRTKPEQFHNAVKEVKKKVQEINRLFEYVSRLKSELSEGEGGLKYKVHTEKALEKIKELVASLNQNVKKFK